VIVLDLLFRILTALASLWLLGLMIAHARRQAANRRLAQRIAGPLPYLPAERISVIVPVKGDLPAAHLADADAAIADCAGELLLVMESDQEPAWTRFHAYTESHPGTRWRVILSGWCPPEDNGKIHNLAAGIDASRGSLLLFVDADVSLSEAMIHHAAALLMEDGVGAVFCPPYYAPSSSLGAGLLAAFTNYWFMPAMARSDERGTLAYCAGACYGIRRAQYDRIPLFHQRRDLISEDAALGQQIVGEGLRIRLVPAVARMPGEKVTGKVALDHLRRWMLLGRVIDPSSFARIPITFEIPIVLLILCVWTLSPFWTLGALIFWLILWPTVFTMIQNRMFWGSPGAFLQPLWWVVFQLIAPFIWLDAAVTRRMSWRGREYTLDRDGKIVLFS